MALWKSLNEAHYPILLQGLKDDEDDLFVQLEGRASILRESSCDAANRPDSLISSTTRDCLCSDDSGETFLRQRKRSIALELTPSGFVSLPKIPALVEMFLSVVIIPLIEMSACAGRRP